MIGHVDITLPYSFPKQSAWVVKFPGQLIVVLRGAPFEHSVLDVTASASGGM